MISGIFHQGSGIGNQLHRYVATKVLALDKGYDHSMIAPELCKVKSFMNLDLPVLKNTFPVPYGIEYGSGKVIVQTKHILWEEETKYYNPEFNFIEDNTVVDGEFQDERYFEHRMNEVDEWLKVDYLEVPDDVCVIGFRGGEFALYPDLFLTKEYWAEARVMMLYKNRNIKFEVHTDDPTTAKKFFPDSKIIQDAGINWRSMRYAKYAIIANSSFYILPRLLKQRGSDGRIERVTGGALTIAPRYWARRNTQTWSMPQNYYSQFTYI